jgi:hypothetical protein
MSNCPNTERRNVKFYNIERRMSNIERRISTDEIKICIFTVNEKMLKKYVEIINFYQYLDSNVKNRAILPNPTQPNQG